MKTTTFSVSNLTDSDLSRLIVECELEQARREQRKATARRKWIKDYFNAFMHHPNATSYMVGEATVVAFYERNTGLRMSSARPIEGDVYDRDTGIAVAFAKALGERIPDYI